MDVSDVKRIRTSLQVAIVGLIFFFIGRTIYSNWQKLGDYHWTFHYVKLCISFGILVFTLLSIALIWRFILRKVGWKLSVKKSLRIWFLSNLGRYIPGKIWQVMGILYLCEREKIPKLASGTSMVLTQALSIVAALLIILPYGMLLGDRRFPGLWLLLFLLIPAVLVVSHPAILGKLLNILSRRLRRGEIRVDIRFPDMLVFLSLFLLGWLAYGLAFFLLVDSIYDIPIVIAPAMVGAFASAYTIGFVSLITPGGLGVREVVLASLLSLYIPLAMATMISLMARIWFTIAEIICCGIALRK